MTKEEFKVRWESDDNGGHINFEDIAICAQKWGIASKPKTKDINIIRYKVLKAANTIDAEDFNPNSN